MEYIVPITLTSIALCSIIYIVVIITSKKNRNVRGLNLKHRQSTIHNIVRSVLPTNEEIIYNIIQKKRGASKNKQSRQRYNPEQIKVVVIGDKAYWIQNNTFYEAMVTENGDIDQSLSKPVDTTNMPIEEVDRLLKIVDDLRRTEKNDGSGSGNQ